MDISAIMENMKHACMYTPTITPPVCLFVLLCQEPAIRLDISFPGEKNSSNFNSTLTTDHRSAYNTMYALYPILN